MLDLLHIDSYDRLQIQQILGRALEPSPLFSAGPKRFPKVLLKPNFVMPAAPADPSTTHPNFYMAVAQLLLERGFQVGIGESPAFGTCRRALRAHDVLDECEALGIEVVEFTETYAVSGVAGDKNYERLTIANNLRDWSALINLPKLKTHQQFVFTGANKNLYGCVVGKRKLIRHNLCANDPVRFARMILANVAAVESCFGSVLHVGDGITAMHVRGPRGGQPFPLGCVIIADDALAHDRLMCELINLDPAIAPLFRALDKGHLASIETKVEALRSRLSFTPATEFRHAPPVHISFAPWALARSAYRTVRYRLQAV